MTAIYDGKLVVSDKAIEPCCKPMDCAIVLGVVRPGTYQKIRIAKISVSDRWCRLFYCPFCGAEVIS